MRKGIILGAGVMAFAVILAFICLTPAKQRAGPWKLADGSELSLAGVTYGKTHAMRYGNRMVDYFYPILTPGLRKRFGCKVATVTSFSSNSIVVWIWQRGVPTVKGSSPFPLMPEHLSVVDENGIESIGAPIAISRVAWQKTNILQGVELRSFPHRSRQFGVRLRRFGDLQLLGEFKVPNRTRTNFPAWIAAPLPLTVKANGLEISLSAFETGIADKGINSGSRAEFTITKNQKACDDWIMQDITAQSGAGDLYGANFWTTSTYGSGGRAVSRGRLPLWPEEPGWKVTAGFWRTTNYPAAEVWIVKGISIPREGQTQDLNLTTNIYASEVELISVTGGKLSPPRLANSKRVRGPAVLRVTSPIPSSDKHLRLATVTDDHGRNVDFHLDEETPSTGGRGATVRQLDKDYYLYVEKDASSVDIMLAYTKLVSVEFMARPTVAKPAH